MIYRNRSEAGKILGAHLSDYADRDDVIVLALPRGGVPVAFEVAKILKSPIDILLVRKIGVPGHEELAMGAISTGGVRVLNDEVVEYWRIPETVIDSVAEEELHELERREREYRGDRPEPEVHGKVVILIDDGLATGSTMRAAVASLRRQNPARIVVAVPVSAPQTCDEYRMGADEIICVITPEAFYGVGQWYEDFSQTTDQEVRDLLRKASLGQSDKYAAAQLV